MNSFLTIVSSFEKIQAPEMALQQFGLIKQVWYANEPLKLLNIAT